MKVRFGLAALGAAIVASGALAGGTLWDNGPLITHPGGGFGGADRSAISPGQGTFGFNSNLTAFHEADDFTVGAGGWNINAIRAFAYQTGSTTTSTFTGLYVQIWDGSPGNGGNVVWGDMTTNLMSGTSWTNIYRTSGTDSQGSTRPIMHVDATGLNINLGAGTYWIEFAMTGTLGSGPWIPLVSDPNQLIAGNARTFTVATATWADTLDATSQLGVEFPFLLEGTVIPTPGAIALLGLAGLASRRRRRA